MRKFLCNILIFGLLFLGTTIPIDYVYSKLATRSHYVSIEAWYDLMNGKIDADVVAVGSSRSWVHINPVILDSVLHVNTYNLGMDGSPVNRQVHKYHLFRKYNRKPKLIIQNIDVWSLNYRIGYQEEQFLPYFWNQSMRNEFFPTEPFSFWEKYIPLYRYLHYSPDIFLNKGPLNLTKGYEGKEYPWDGSSYMNVESIPFIVSDTSAVLFDEFLSQAKSEKIKVVFVYAPLYIGATHKISNLEGMRAKYQEFADKYDIPVLDYTYMDICYDTNYFYNAMHLNKLGSEIFSDSLANDILKLHILN